MEISVDFLKDYLNSDSDNQESMLSFIGDNEAQCLLNQLELDVLQEQLASFQSEKFKGFISSAIAAY